MKKNISTILIIGIILAFISGIIPLIGIIVGILLLFVHFKLKKYTLELNEQITILSAELEKSKLTKEEIALLDLKSEQQSLENKVNTSKETLISLGNEINAKNSKLEELHSILKKNEQIISKLDVIASLDEQITIKKANLGELDDAEMYQSFGLYKPVYDLINSEKYKFKLEQIRTSQKELIKNKTAVDYSENWTLDGSITKGRAMTNDNIKLILRSFNNECDACILKVKFNNIDSIKTRIMKSFELLNNLGTRNLISIRREYLNLKLEELYLSYEYELKKQEEKEDQFRIKEQMREEAKALKEIENIKKKIEKEENHFKNAIVEVENQLSTCSEDEKNKLLNKIEELNNSLKELEKDKEDIENRENNTRAGYVYIISNIGSFGNDVYKIGMTRRLEPIDRVKELGDASVPFQFDIHAMIFSDDAPALENALHKTFANNSVNKINMRKEFFRVSLEDIQSEVKKNYNEVVEFTKLAEAPEYRQTLQIEKESQKQTA